MGEKIIFPFLHEYNAMLTDIETRTTDSVQGVSPKYSAGSYGKSTVILIHLLTLRNLKSCFLCSSRYEKFPQCSLVPTCSPGLRSYPLFTFKCSPSPRGFVQSPGFNTNCTPILLAWISLQNCHLTFHDIVMCIITYIFGFSSVSTKEL